ncbi:MAG: FkbM family methyltransferase [Ignavibacteria bacterium]|nr:FkbM family methyltransferase [Ignavibacteria bacterium]
MDDGTIDLLSVDIEGGEWFVVKHLVSRPDVISIETHWKNYSNPYLKEINEWMSDNDYQIWYIDKSDTVYFKNNLFKLTVLEKAELKFKGK